MARDRIIFASDSLVGPASKYQGMKNVNIFVNYLRNKFQIDIFTLLDKYNYINEDPKIHKINYLALKENNFLNLLIFKLFNFINIINFARKHKIKYVFELISDPILANKSVIYKMFGINFISVFFVENQNFNRKVNYLFFKPRLILFSSSNYIIPHRLKKISKKLELGIDIKFKVVKSKFNKLKIIYFGLMTKNKGFNDIMYLIKKLPQNYEFHLYINEVRFDNKEFKSYKKDLEYFKNKKIYLYIKNFKLSDVWKHNGLFIYPTLNYHGTLSQPAILLEYLNLKKKIIVREQSNSKDIMEYYMKEKISYKSHRELLKKVINFKRNEIIYNKINERNNRYFIKNTSNKFCEIISETKKNNIFN